MYCTYIYMYIYIYIWLTNRLLSGILTPWVPFGRHGPDAASSARLAGHQGGTDFGSDHI